MEATLEGLAAVRVRDVEIALVLAREMKSASDRNVDASLRLEQLREVFGAETLDQAERARIQTALQMAGLEPVPSLLEADPEEPIRFAVDGSEAPAPPADEVAPEVAPAEEPAEPEQPQEFPTVGEFTKSAFQRFRERRARKRRGGDEEEVQPPDTTQVGLPPLGPEVGLPPLEPEAADSEFDPAEADPAAFEAETNGHAHLDFDDVALPPHETATPADFGASAETVEPDLADQPTAEREAVSLDALAALERAEAEAAEALAAEAAEVEAAEAEAAARAEAAAAAEAEEAEEAAPEAVEPEEAEPEAAEAEPVADAPEPEMEAAAPEADEEAAEAEPVAEEPEPEAAEPEPVAEEPEPEAAEAEPVAEEPEPEAEAPEPEPVEAVEPPSDTDAAATAVHTAPPEPEEPEAALAATTAHQVFYAEPGLQPAPQPLAYAEPAAVEERPVLPTGALAAILLPVVAVPVLLASFVGWSFGLPFVALAVIATGFLAARAGDGGLIRTLRTFPAARTILATMAGVSAAAVAVGIVLSNIDTSGSDEPDPPAAEEPSEPTDTQADERTAEEREAAAERRRERREERRAQREQRQQEEGEEQPATTPPSPDPDTEGLVRVPPERESGTAPGATPTTPTEPAPTQP